jgi:hypothetical protein
MFLKFFIFTFVPEFMLHPLLLHFQNDCHVFESLRTIDNVTYDKFKDAVTALNI